MPGTDGFQMCRDLKTRRDLQHIPVIFITALSDPESEEKGFDAGAVDYIHKPIRLPAVRARVRTHISMSGMLDHMITLNQDLKKRLENSTIPAIPAETCLRASSWPPRKVLFFWMPNAK